ncbi:Citrate transporter [Planctomycetes bacterium Poly30]|uniref:Citrate transporter n=1 Tax=Saltatorellus ferox TaxID=2528018 RepID=A0A518EU67_9BACT|nr:Citrate transporter [Planctomycetes bacterium Poly30]
MLEPQTIVLAVLIGSFLLFVTDAVRYELTALGVVVVLVLSGCLTVEEGFQGFSSNAVVLIASMYIFGHAFTKSGLAEGLGRRMIGRSKPQPDPSQGGTLTGRVHEAGLVLRMTVASGVLSSVLSNTGVVATLIPVASSISRKMRIPLSKLLLPLAFGSLVGGLVTVIATSTNIAINDLLREIEGSGGPFGLFEFSQLGLVLLLVTTLYFAGPGRWLLPTSSVEETLSERYQVPKFVTEVLVEPTSELINRNVADIDMFQRFNVAVLGIVRAGGERPVLAPGPYNRVRAQDTLILQGAPDDVLRLSEVLPIRRRESVEAGDTRLYSDDVRLVEAVIPAGSEYIGQSLASSEFRTRTGLNVLAMSRHGELQLKRLQEVTLDIGDTLLVQGHLPDISRARRQRQLLVLDEVQAPIASRRSWIVLATLATVLLGAAFTDQPLAILGMAGALVLVLTKVVLPDEVPKIIDLKVIALVGGMLALGTAFQRVGLDKSFVHSISSTVNDGFSHRGALALLLVVTMILTQVLNNVSTAVIMTGIAVELAQTLGVSPRPLLMAVVTGSSLAFLSPVAHQANAMVMGPGGYRYKDFLIVGLPLAILTGVTSVLLIPVWWPF